MGELTLVWLSSLDSLNGERRVGGVINSGERGWDQPIVKY